MKTIGDTSQQFYKAVIREINAIKKNATKEEILKLKISKFEPDHTEQCIYGQMTGHCDSLRANKLISISCVAVITGFSTLGEVGERLIKPTQAMFKQGYRRDVYSSLEHFIAREDYKKYSPNILKYIKGKTTELKVKELLN